MHSKFIFSNRFQLINIQSNSLIKYNKIIINAKRRRRSQRRQQRRRIQVPLTLSHQKPRTFPHRPRTLPFWPSSPSSRAWQKYETFPHRPRTLPFWPSSPSSRAWQKYEKLRKNLLLDTDGQHIQINYRAHPDEWNTHDARKLELSYQSHEYSYRQSRCYHVSASADHVSHA